MGYDKELLKSWCDDESWGDYLSRKGALVDNVSTEQFKAIEKEYFDALKERIDICEDILRRHKDGFVNYVLAQLYDKDDVDRSPETLCKRKVIYHCLQAIKENSNFAPTWVLLAETYEWIATLGDESDTMPKMEVSVRDKHITANIRQKDQLGIASNSQDVTIQYIEKAISCIKRAIAIEPSNKEYQGILRSYYRQRNEDYRR